MAALRRAGLATLLVWSWPSAYLLVLTATGLPRSRRGAAFDGEPQTGFSLLVPAHDEAAGIGRTLATIGRLDYPSELFECHVVADNCTDETADVVRACGYEAHERTDTERPGKGFALNWLIARLADRGDLRDVVVVIDADTDVDPGMLAAFDAAFRQGATAAQGRYLVRDPHASAATSIRLAALACRHHLRSLGRVRLGGSCGLFGNGMAFRRATVAHRPWSNHLVEDAEFQLELLLDGVHVRYVPGAQVVAEMPVELDQSASQHARWERGRSDLVRGFVPRLVRRAVRADRLACADAIADLALPPLSVLVAANTALFAAAAPLSLRSRGAGVAAIVAAANVGVLVAHTIAGLWSVEADRTHYAALRSAPTAAIWKSRLWWNSLTADHVAWTRTTRNTEAG